jgi:hypothetical protein
LPDRRAIPRKSDSLVSARDRRRSRKIAARTVPGDAQASRVAPKFVYPRDHVTDGAKAILERRREGRFRRTPIVDRNDDGAGLNRKPSRLPVMRVQIACYKPAAMKE